MNRWELEKQIVLRALKDPAFKKKLLANPKQAVKELFKNEIPQDILNKIQIKIHEEKQSEWTIPLPYLETGNKKLTDAELEKLFAAAGCPAVQQLGTTY